MTGAEQVWAEPFSVFQYSSRNPSFSDAVRFGWSAIRSTNVSSSVTVSGSSSMGFKMVESGGAALVRARGAAPAP